MEATDQRRLAATLVSKAAPTAIILACGLLRRDNGKMRLPKFQFSLRTLLIVMTAVCLYLAAQFQWAREQREAVEAVRRASGNVYYDYEGLTKSHSGRSESWAPKWAIDRLGIDFFHTAIQAQGVRRGGLPALAHLRKLRWVEIEDWQVTDRDLEPLSSLGQLETLEIRAPSGRSGRTNTLVTDKSLATVSHCRRLSRLRIDGLAFSDEGIEHLLQIPGLQIAEIYAYDSKISQEGVERLKQHPMLESVETSGWNGLMISGTGRFDRSGR
jgi:hypothetical protein